MQKGVTDRFIILLVNSVWWACEGVLYILIEATSGDAKINIPNYTYIFLIFIVNCQIKAYKINTNYHL